MRAVVAVSAFLAMVCVLVVIGTQNSVTELGGVVRDTNSIDPPNYVEPVEPKNEKTPDSASGKLRFRRHDSKKPRRHTRFSGMIGRRHDGASPAWTEDQYFIHQLNSNRANPSGNAMMGMMGGAGHMGAASMPQPFSANAMQSGPSMMGPPA